MGCWHSCLRKNNKDILISYLISYSMVQKELSDFFLTIK